MISSRVNSSLLIIITTVLDKAELKIIFDWNLNHFFAWISGLHLISLIRVQTNGHMPIPRNSHSSKQLSTFIEIISAHSLKIRAK